MAQSNPLPGLANLIKTVAALRNPIAGCPWDRAQNHDTLKPYALEETHEFLESLETHGPRSPETWEELGDVLFQVVLHAQLLAEEKLTDLDTIAARTAQKLVERHPHVFDPNAERFETPEQVNLAWERLKAERKKNQPTALPLTRAARVSSVPRSLPALQRAARVGEKAAAFRFDWQDAAQVMAKVQEELRELEEAEASGNTPHAQEELGDLLFALTQFARKKHWDPEAILAQATRKFTSRFETMERLIERDSAQGWDEMSSAQLESYWEKAKKLGPISP